MAERFLAFSFVDNSDQACLLLCPRSRLSRAPCVLRSCCGDDSVCGAGMRGIDMEASTATTVSAVEIWRKMFSLVTILMGLWRTLSFQIRFHHACTTGLHNFFRSTLVNQAFGTAFPVGGPLGQGDTTGEGGGGRGRFRRVSMFNKAYEGTEGMSGAYSLSLCAHASCAVDPICTQWNQILWFDV